MYALNEAGVSAVGESGSAVLQGRASNSGSVVGVAATADGQGYYLVTSAGYVYTFGDAQYYGSMGGQSLSRPIVGITVDKATGGYWLVGADGGVFAFNAPFDAERRGGNPVAPIVGMAATPDGGGYWLAGSDGGVFNFGDAQLQGTCYTIGGCGTPITGIAGSSDSGYWLAGQNGGVFSFNAPFDGSEGGKAQQYRGHHRDCGTKVGVLARRLRRRRLQLRRRAVRRLDGRQATQCPGDRYDGLGGCWVLARRCRRWAVQLQRAVFRQRAGSRIAPAASAAWGLGCRRLRRLRDRGRRSHRHHRGMAGGRRCGRSESRGWCS